MKTRMAMAISIAGVLVAGSAAALVNTQVLSGSADASPFEARANTTEPSSTVVVSVPGDTSATTVATVVPAASGTTAQAASPATQAAYPIGDSTVVLDTAGDTLTIVSLTPAAGWTVTKAETDDATNVEIQLQSGTNELEFHANLLFGVVTTSVESKDNATTDNATTDNSTTASSVADSHGGGHGADDGSGGSSHSHGGDD